MNRFDIAIGKKPLTETTENMSSTQRGTEMMGVPMKDLPVPAIEYARYLCSETGMCGEVMLTAYCYYAEVMEHLAPDDEAYRATSKSR